MARLLEMNMREKVKEFLQFVVLLYTIQCFSSNVQAVESHSEAFIQTDKHLTHIDFSGIPIEINPGVSVIDNSRDVNFFTSTIRLDPPMLDFQEQPVGMPRMERVIVQNNDPKNSLQLLYISGSTTHFHCSFFQDKIVPPGGNTSFDVVFLARQVGNVENTLHIQTSAGSIQYQVFGVGIPNPYRLRPYLGARVPLNSSFSPLIQMHNPHSTKLQVIEMFSSVGDLHLELPSGGKEEGQEVWEIQPFETKSVMRANFVGRTADNHTAFIRIKTSQDAADEMLILPMEVEVSQEPGIYSPVEVIDFGILRTLDEPKTVKLHLLNTQPKPIHIVNVTVSPPNDAISIDFRPTKLPAESHRQTAVAQITFRAQKALHPRQWSGKILVKSKDSQRKLAVPYRADILHGSLVYKVNGTHFFSAKALRNITRPMTFTNTFNFSIVIYNITLPPQVAQYFSILNFSQPVVLQPQQSGTPLVLKFHPNVTQLHFTTSLTIHSNASTFLIPLVVYNGLLKVIHHRPEKFKGQLDFGTMGVGETRNMIFTVRNENPVDIVVAEFSSNNTRTKVEILGIEKGNGTTLTRAHNQSEIETDPLIIKPYHYAVFSVTVSAPREEGAFAEEVLIVSQFQDLFIPMTLRTAEGCLHAVPETFVFDKVYPGKVPYKVLQIHSTFEDFMEVTQVAFQPGDARFHFTAHENKAIKLKPQEHTMVGKIYFDAKRECRDDCYVGLPTYTPAGHQWLLGLLLDREVADTDQYLYTKLRQKWERIEKSDQNIANVTIELDTNQVRGFLFSAQAHLHWPSLVRKAKLKFPLTQIGNTTVMEFMVENPGDTPVLVQIVSISHYPSPHTIVDLMSQRHSTDWTDYIDTEDLDTFSLQDLEFFTSIPPSPLVGHRRQVEAALGVRVHNQSLAAILQPGMKVKIKVAFQPKDDQSRASMFVIRNNLTIIDAVVVEGRGCQGEMRFSNKKPGSSAPLVFDMTEKHLTHCDNPEKKHSKIIPPQFTVRRTFTLKNSGELPFYVQYFSINSSPCEGYGFKVLDCDGFEMHPNSSRKVDIAFTPDFTMSRVRRMLTIHTSLGPPVNYTLQATVPPHLLSKCSEALPRPTWEPPIYYIIVCSMVFLLSGILVFAYIEHDRIFLAEFSRRRPKSSSCSSGQPQFDKSKVFDLRSVGFLSSKTPPSGGTHGSGGGGGEGPRAPRLLSQLNGHGPPSHHHHRQQPQLAQESFLQSMTRVLKSLVPASLFHSSSKPHPTSRQNSQEETPNSHSSNGASVVNGKVHSDQSTPRESQPEPSVEKISNGPKTRKSKLNRRNSDTSSQEGTGEGRKQSKDVTPIPDQRHITDIDQVDLETPRLAKTKWDQNDNHDTAFLVDSEVKDHLLPTRSAAKTGKSGKKKGRSRPELDHFKDRLLTTNIADDRDEVSSTTTESSGGGDDEKHSSARDSTPEPTIPPPAAKKTKKQKAAKEPVYVDGHINNDDDEFTLTSKSKAHRKIRIDPKETYGGNINEPSSLELPYSLDPKTKDGEDIGSKVRKSGRGSKSKGKGDLSELALQTETFAQKHSKGLGSGHGTNGLCPDSLSGSSRSSSYSSIVSSPGAPAPSPDPSFKAQTKTPSQEDKNYPSGFSPFENSLPGLISPKPVLVKPTPTSRPKNPWLTPPSSPTSPETVAPNYLLQPIAESTSTSYGLQTTASLDSFSAPLSYSMVSGGEQSYTSSRADPIMAIKPPTMMQELQAERRQRIREHQLKVKNQGRDWPGFDVPPVCNDSLWDNDCNPMESTTPWSPATDSPPGGGSIWSALSSQAASGWNSITSIWGSSPTTTVGSALLPEPAPYAGTPLPVSTPQVGSPGPAMSPIPACTPQLWTPPVNHHHHHHHHSIPTSNVQQTTSMETPAAPGTFDPFNSMAGIWSPNPTSSSSSWGPLPRGSDDKTPQ